jgi:hypothetical protein
VRRRLLALGAFGALACGHANAPAPNVVPPPPKVITGDLDGTVLLGDLPKVSAKAGGGTTTVVATGLLAEGERLGAFVEVPEDMCLLAYARASSSVDDIDVVIFAEEGNPIASDEGPDPKPTVMLCPPHPRRVYLAAHGAGGEGLVAIAAELVPPARAADVAKAVGARGGFGEGPRPADAWPGLDEKLRAHRNAIGGTWEDVRRVALPVDARAASMTPVSAAAGQCLDVLLVPDDDVAGIDLSVFDGDRREVARARDGGRDRALVLCTGYAFEGTLEVRPHVGAGLVAIVIARAPRASAPDLATRVDTVWYGTEASIDKARTAHDQAMAKAGYAAPAVLGTGSLTVGRRATVAAELGDPGCSRIDVVAGAPLTLVAARARDDKGTLRGGGEGAAGATLFACGGGKVTVELDAKGRGGPFVVLSRPEKLKNDAFAKKPLAASRMLARTVPVAGAPAVAPFGDVRSFVVDGARVERFDVTVPPQTCSNWAFGVEGEGTGIQVAVLDAITGDELDRAAGATSTQARVCTSTAARKIKVEVGATTGKLDVIVAESRTASTP